jgi:hypothetical protein
MKRSLGLRRRCGIILMVLPTSHNMMIEIANPHWFSKIAIDRKMGPSRRVNTEMKRSIIENARYGHFHTHPLKRL